MAMLPSDFDGNTKCSTEASKRAETTCFVGEPFVYMYNLHTALLSFANFNQSLSTEFWSVTWLHSYMLDKPGESHGNGQYMVKLVQGALSRSIPW